MILLRPRESFRTGLRKRWPIAKITRRERAANLRARQAIVDEFEPKFIEVYDTFRRDSDQSFRRQLTTGGAIGADQSAVGVLEADIAAALGDSFSDGLADGQQIGLRFSGAPDVDLNPDLVTERADRWIASEGARRIKGINDRETRTIRNSVRQALRDEVSPELAARRISREVGLTPRDAAALENFRRRRLRTLIPTPEADTQFARETVEAEVENRRARMISRRGRVIAENEMQVAIQEGERQFWDEAIASGQIDESKLIKRWFTIEDDRRCPICIPLHGQIRPFKDSFSSLGFTGLGPPAHPRCRCFLEFGPEGNLDDKPPEPPRRRGPTAQQLGTIAGVTAFAVGAGLAARGVGPPPQRTVIIPFPERSRPIIPLIRPHVPFPIAARRKPLSKHRPRTRAKRTGQRFGIY